MYLQITSLIFFLTIGFMSASYTQLSYLRLSPAQKMEQRIGATDVTLEFSRPQAKGRTIFGGLIPYRKLWRTGANENTKLTFSYKVKIGNADISAGTYALFTKPMKEKWEVFLYKDTNNFDVPNPIDSSKLLFLTSVIPTTTSHFEETLVINFYDITETTAALGINWENTAVRIPVQFFTREAMEAQINNSIKQNALDLGTTAAYYYERDIELEKARKLQELSIELRTEPSSWAYNSYGIIL